MVPAVLKETTRTLLRKYRPTFASLHARAKAPRWNDSGNANGLPRKISVLDLKLASTVHASGATTVTAHTASARWARVDSGLGRRRPPSRPGAATRRPPVRAAGAFPVARVSIVMRDPYNSTASRLVTRSARAANVMVRKNSATPMAEA